MRRLRGSAQHRRVQRLGATSRQPGRMAPPPDLRHLRTGPDVPATGHRRTAAVRLVPNHPGRTVAKKIAGGLLALFIFYFVATKPVAAAACAKGIGSILIT